MGFFGINYPEEFGGLNLDLFYTVIFLEELQKINSGGFAANLWAHTYLAMTHLDKEGSQEIKENYLAASITGDKIGCLCITEPFGGSDVSGLRTTAIKNDDTYVLNGSKTFITNGVYSDYLVVAAKTNIEKGAKGISIFLVDRNTAGINAHARAEFALEYTIQYMKDRTAFGQSISKFQALRHSVAQMSSELEVCKAFNYTTAKRLNDGEYVVKEATMAKLTSTKMADDIIYQCLQLLGGYGYMEEYPLARLFRDSRLGPIGGGTSEILREIIAKMIIDGKDYKPVT